MQKGNSEYNWIDVFQEIERKKRKSITEMLVMLK